MTKIAEQSSQAVIIAEVGSVHDGSYGNALRLVDVAAPRAAPMPSSSRPTSPRPRHCGTHRCRATSRASRATSTSSERGSRSINGAA